MKIRRTFECVPTEEELIYLKNAALTDIHSIDSIIDELMTNAFLLGLQQQISNSDIDELVNSTSFKLYQNPEE